MPRRVVSLGVEVEEEEEEEGGRRMQRLLRDMSVFACVSECLNVVGKKVMKERSQS